MHKTTLLMTKTWLLKTKTLKDKANTFKGHGRTLNYLYNPRKDLRARSKVVKNKTRV